MNIKKSILLLQSKDITQAEIASSVGCTQSNISHLIKSKARRNPNPSKKVVDGLRKLLAEHGLTEPNG